MPDSSAYEGSQGAARAGGVEIGPTAVASGHFGVPPTPVTCASCVAVCCRLTVVLEPGDDVPAALVARVRGIPVMAKDAAGWCVALDRSTMACSIYAQRPQACRRFAMNGPYCRAIRIEHAHVSGLAQLA